MPLTNSKSAAPLFRGPLEGFILLPCFALACFRMFASVAPSTGDFDGVLSLVQTLALVLLVVAERRVSYGRQTLRCLVAVACVAVAVGGIISAGAFDATGILIGGILRNVGSAALIFSIGYYLCSIKLAFALLTIVSGFALNGVASLAVSLVPSGGFGLLSVVFALGSGVCLVWGLDRVPLCEDGGDVSDVSWQETFRLPWLWLLLPVVFLNVVLEMTMSGVRVHESSNYIWLVIYLIDFLATFVWVCLLRREDVEKLLPVFIAILFLGPLFFLSFQSFAQEFSTGVAIAIRRTNMLVVWSYLVVAAKHTNLPSPVVFSLGHAFCLQLPRVLGMLFRPVFNGIDEGTSSLIGAIAVFATIATVMCFGLRRYLASDKENARRSIGLADSSPQAPLSESASENESIFEGFGLTRRETEVAGFLRSAYSLPEIASRLYISHGTVRTHVKNIYAKAGVRSRQEFLVLLEEKGAKR